LARRALVLAAVLVFVVGMAGAVGGAPRGQSSDATPKSSPVAGTPGLLATVQAQQSATAGAKTATAHVGEAQTATSEAETVVAATNEAFTATAAAQTAVANAVAVATQNAELQAALSGQATSQAEAENAAATAQAQLADAQATIAAQATEIAGWQATGTAIALPTATPTAIPTETPTPSPTATETPEPTATPLPKAGDVLYTADTSGGLEQWSAGGSWHYLNGMLVNDGTSHGDVTIAPYQPTIPDYAVEFDAQILQPDGDINCHDSG
jgi:hypothetical protein